MKNYWIKNLKIIAIGLALSLWLSYLGYIAHVNAQGGQNPDKPLYAYTSAINQYKEGALTIGSSVATTTSGVFLDVKASAAAGSTGVLGTNTLLVSQEGKADKGLFVLNGSTATGVGCPLLPGGPIPINCTEFNTTYPNLGANVQVDGSIRSVNLVSASQKAVCADGSGILVLCSLPGQSDLVINLAGTGYGNVSATPAGDPALTAANCVKTASATVTCPTSPY